MTTHTISPKASLTQILGASCTREDALALLQKYPECYSAFRSFKPRYQEQLLSFLQGKAGLSITYNSFFQHILNPETHPRRLESLLSALIGESVTIRQVLPNEGERLAEHGSLVIMDVIAELTDGSIVDVEMQKIGYHFPGQRSSCYVSDMIMRQYNRVKSDRKKNFSYQDLKPVYLIILMEKSPEEFHTYPYEYIHRRITSYTSGIRLPELAHITYISLDTFHSIVQNVDTELDAWLTFLSSTEASRIIPLVQNYPEFLEFYKDIALFRTSPKELITMFSEALSILDQNTVQYMIDEQNQKILEQEQLLKENRKQLAANQKELTENQKALAENQKALAESQRQHSEDQRALAESKKQHSEAQKRIAELEEQLQQLQK